MSAALAQGLGRYDVCNPTPTPLNGLGAARYIQRVQRKPGSQSDCPGVSVEWVGLACVSWQALWLN